MPIVIMITYEFVSATGGWSTHSGFGAFVFFLLFCASLIWSCVLATMAPSWYTWGFSKFIGMAFGKNVGKIFLNLFDFADLLLTGFWVGPFIVAPISFILYFFSGFGDFADGGWLMSSSRDINWLDWLLLAYIAFGNYSLFDRFYIKEPDGHTNR